MIELGVGTVQCPLCLAPTDSVFYRGKNRIFLTCYNCGLVFVPALYHLAAQDEKAHYDLHENNPDDAGYRNFLSRMFKPLQTRLPPASAGLDFGSGPGPTLSLIFEEAGHRMRLYDIHYAPDRSVLVQNYDFITATEVVEHLASPGTELAKLWSRVNPGGWLGLMTKLVLDRQAFDNWHYKNDPTHITFFSRQSFSWLGSSWGVEAEFVGDDVILFQKPLANQKPLADKKPLVTLQPMSK